MNALSRLILFILIVTLHGCSGNELSKLDELRLHYDATVIVERDLQKGEKVGWARLNNPNEVWVSSGSRETEHILTKHSCVLERKLCEAMNEGKRRKDE